MSLEAPNRPGRLALDRLVVELLVRGFDYQRNIHDAIETLDSQLRSKPVYVAERCRSAKGPCRD